MSDDNPILQPGFGTVVTAGSTFEIQVSFFMALFTYVQWVPTLPASLIVQVQIYNSDDEKVSGWPIFPWDDLSTDYPNNGTFLWHVNATTRPDSSYFVYLYWDVVSSTNYNFTYSEPFQIVAPTSATQGTSHTGLIVGVVVGGTIFLLIVLAGLTSVCKGRLDKSWQGKLERSASQRRAYLPRAQGHFDTSTTTGRVQPEVTQIRGTPTAENASGEDREIHS